MSNCQAIVIVGGLYTIYYRKNTHTICFL